MFTAGVITCVALTTCLSRRATQIAYSACASLGPREPRPASFWDTDWSWRIPSCVRHQARPTGTYARAKGGIVRQGGPGYWATLGGPPISQEAPHRPNRCGSCRPPAWRACRIQELTSAGLNLESVRQVMAPEGENEHLLQALARVRLEARQAVEDTHRPYRRDLVPLRSFPCPSSAGHGSQSPAVRVNVLSLRCRGVGRRDSRPEAARSGR